MGVKIKVQLLEKGIRYFFKRISGAGYKNAVIIQPWIQLRVMYQFYGT